MTNPFAPKTAAEAAGIYWQGKLDPSIEPALRNKFGRAVTAQVALDLKVDQWSNLGVYVSAHEKVPSHLLQDALEECGIDESKLLVEVTTVMDVDMDRVTVQETPHKTVWEKP